MALALVLKEKGRLALRAFPLPAEMCASDVRIAIRTVGVYGPDGQHLRPDNRVCMKPGIPDPASCASKPAQPLSAGTSKCLQMNRPDRRTHYRRELLLRKEMV